jgi:hypothetical protein
MLSNVILVPLLWRRIQKARSDPERIDADQTEQCAKGGLPVGNGDFIQPRALFKVSWLVELDQCRKFGDGSF